MYKITEYARGTLTPNTEEKFSWEHKGNYCIHLLTSTASVPKQKQRWLKSNLFFHTRTASSLFFRPSLLQQHWRIKGTIPTTNKPQIWKWILINVPYIRQDIGQITDCLCHLTEVGNLVHFQTFTSVQTLQGNIPAWVCLPRILVLEKFVRSHSPTGCNKAFPFSLHASLEG